MDGLPFQRGDTVLFDGERFVVGPIKPYVRRGKTLHHVELLRVPDNRCLDLTQVEEWLDRITLPTSPQPKLHAYRADRPRRRAGSY